MKTKTSDSRKVIDNNNNKTVVSLTKGSIISYIITTIIFIVYGILLTYTDITEEKIQIVVMITTVISVLIGGIIASRGVNSKGLIFGMLVGVIYSIIMIMIGFCILPTLKITSKMIMIFILSISSGGIGGIIGINSKK